MPDGAGNLCAGIQQGRVDRIVGELSTQRFGSLQTPQRLVGTRPERPNRAKRGAELQAHRPETVEQVFRRVHLLPLQLRQASGQSSGKTLPGRKVATHDRPLLNAMGIS